MVNWPGTVHKPDPHAMPCPACKGTGERRDDAKGETSTCMVCKGKRTVTA